MKAAVGKLRYFAEDALEEWRHSTGPTLLATASLAAVLFVAGVVLLVLANLSMRLDEWRGGLRVEIFLRDGASGEDLEAVRRKLEDMPGVARIAYVDKEEALARFRKTFRALADVPAEIGANPLPASFEVFLGDGPAPGSVARAIATVLSDQGGVEEVRYDQEVLDRVARFLEVATWSGAALAILVLGALVFVMAGILRLAVYARRDDVEIMMLVGATPGFIRGPFLLAGGIQGLVGGLLALGLVEIVRRATIARIGGDPTPFVDLVLGRALSIEHAASLVAVGLAVGLSSAWFAVRRVET